MNKIFNSKIFLIFITAVICIGGTVTATTLYHSNQVSYNDTNVEEALNNLYARISKVYYLGVGTSFDIKTLLPSIDYTKLTIDDFVSTGEIADSISSNSNYDNGGNPLRSESSSSLSYIKNYDKDTGILTCYARLNTNSLVRYKSGPTGYSSSNTKNISVHVYLIKK